ncbi:hypothetical protein BGZ54_000341 [Gamsiella multidivaricata]|nr:hypothetical protein BGZ54_000341 [Gamsiella multidivaricata]
MKHIGSQSEFNSQLTAAGSRLVVVDFFATWCGPCKTLAPVLEGLEKKHTSTIFAKVDVDQAKDCAETYEVTAMPTIVFFKSKSEVGRVVGVNMNQIQALIKEHEGGDAFSGVGQTLGGSSSSTTGSGSNASMSTSTKTVEGPGGSCQIQLPLPSLRNFGARFVDPTLGSDVNVATAIAPSTTIFKTANLPRAKRDRLGLGLTSASPQYFQDRRVR